MSELQYHDSIKAMMTPIREAIVGDAETGQITGSIDASVLEKMTLPEGVTPELLKTAMDVNADVMTATKAVMGEWGVDTMKGNDKLDVVGLKMDYLNSSLEGRVQRMNTYGKDENAVTKYGQTTLTHRVKGCGTRGASARVGKIINQLAENSLAAEALA